MVPEPLFEIEGSNLGVLLNLGMSPGFEPEPIVFTNRRRLVAVHPALLARR